MATTMADEAQWRPRATSPSDTSATDAPMPPKASGTMAERRPSARNASMVSAGNRPVTSTSSAAGAATSSAIRSICCATPPDSDTGAVVSVMLVIGTSTPCHLDDTGANGSDRLERGFLEHLL